jgi:hypothetical protein
MDPETEARIKWFEECLSEDKYDSGCKQLKDSVNRPCRLIFASFFHWVLLTSSVVYSGRTQRLAPLSIATHYFFEESCDRMMPDIFGCCRHLRCVELVTLRLTLILCDQGAEGRVR